jgi:hypothetical protein
MRAKATVADLLEGYPLMDALSHYEYYETGAVVKPIVLLDHLHEFIEHGVKGLWTYNCCAPDHGYSNRFLAMTLSRNRSIALLLYRFNIEGFLHWGYNFYYNSGSADCVNPFLDTSSGNMFPSGDPFSVYPGEGGEPLESMRLLTFHEALQDVAALKLCEALYSRDEVIAALEEMLGDEIKTTTYVNDAATYNCAGELPLASYVANYEKLVRVAHTAIKSHNPDGHVYVSLDSHRSSTGMEGGWDVPSFLSAFNDECALRGNYDWYVACDLYADTPDIWVENAELDAARYTVHSLRTLTDLLVSDKFRTSDGKERGLLISGFAIPAVVQGGTPSEGNNAKQSASYAYAYMTCVQNGYVEALVYSAYADTDQNGDREAQCGLWTLNEQGETLVIFEKRPLYDLFKKIDTSDAPTLSGELTALIDEPYTKLERALAGQTQPVTVVTGETALEGYGTGYHKTTTLYSFGEGILHGFGDAGELSYLSLVKAETLGTQNLHAAFERDEICDPMGIFVTLPASRLLGGRELLMDLYAGADAENAGRPEVTVRLTSPATEDRGTVIYEATATEVRDGVWQTAVFDIEDFTASLSRDDEVILTVLMDYPPESAMYEDAHMGISQISVTGKTGGGQMAPWLIITLIAVPCVLVVGGFVVLLVIRRRRRW